MLNFIRHVLGNGEKIAIGNKMCMVLFLLTCLGTIISLLWESREYAKIEAKYSKLSVDLLHLANQNMQNVEIIALKTEIENLEVKFTEVQEKYAPYHAEIIKQRDAEAAKDKLDEDFKLQFSLWNGSHRKTVEYVKERMHNPKSFEHVETRYIDYAEKGYCVIQMKYRGTNLYNAIVTNLIWVKVDLHGNVFEVIRNQ